jgi:hypothetical protein
MIVQRGMRGSLPLCQHEETINPFLRRERELMSDIPATDYRDHRTNSVVQWKHTSTVWLCRGETHSVRGQEGWEGIAVADEINVAGRKLSRMVDWNQSKDWSRVTSY